MTSLLRRLSMLLTATFFLFVLSGCNMTDGQSMLSSGDNTPLPTGSTPFSSIIPDITNIPTVLPSDDMQKSDIEGIGEGIKDFVEGTVVDIMAVPEIVKAVTDKYENATVTRITHAMHLDKQVYKVEYRGDDGMAHTVYVSPDGKEIMDAVEPEMSTSPSLSPSPSASPKEEG